MKVMVLDDEPILRQGIINKVRMSRLPLDIIGQAADGISGMELVRSEAPDIVITDIRMPGMDGLAFIEEAQRVNDRLCFIIISGFNDFEYAQKAIQFGVSDYLLKPVEDEELWNSLSKIIRNLEKVRKSKEEISQLWSFHEIYRETMRQHDLTKIIEPARHTHQPSLETEELLQGVQHLSSHYLAVLLVLESFPLPHRSFGTDDAHLIWFSVANMLSDRLSCRDWAGIVFQHAIHEHEMVYLLGFKSPNDFTAIRNRLEDVLQGIQKYLGLQVTISIGNVVDNMNRIRQSYDSAKAALRNKIIKGPGKIHVYDWLQKQSASRQPFLFDDEEHLLFQYLNDCNENALKSWLEKRIRSIVDYPSATCSDLEWFCVDLYLLFRKYLLGKTDDSEWLIGEMNDLLVWLQCLNRWEDAVEQMQRYVGNIAGYLIKIKHSPNSDVMVEVKQYLRLHFHESVTLQSMAERFYFHPNYFSRRFKEKFGESFIDHLTGLRMQKAAEWMRETELKIQQIAAMVGFDDAAYFSSVFRKTFGISPKQFRDNLINF